MPIGQSQAMWQCMFVTNVTNASGAISNIYWPNASDASWWPNLQLTQVAPSGSQICNQCKWCNLVAKYETNVNGAMWLLYQFVVTESISGSVVTLAMFPSSFASVCKELM